MQQPQGLQMRPMQPVGFGGMKPGVTPTASQRGGSFNALTGSNANNAPQHDDAKTGIQDHYDKASSVCGHIDDLVAALTELYEENAKWKQKYITTKKAHFSKFFGASATMLLGTTFREWKSWTFEMNATRKYEGLLQDHELSERTWQKKFEELENEAERRLKELEEQHKAAISELSDQINARNQQINKLQHEKDRHAKRSEKIHKVLMSMKSQTDAIDEDLLLDFDDDAQEKKYPVNSNEFLKAKLHDLLNQVDPKYVPPLGSLSLMPPPGPAGHNHNHNPAHVNTASQGGPTKTGYSMGPL